MSKFMLIFEAQLNIVNSISFVVVIWLKFKQNHKEKSEATCDLAL